jgi:hypothetical protein
VQVYEFYFYPEYALKNKKLKLSDPSKIMFMGLKEFE